MVKLSISNIAWGTESDARILPLLHKHGFTGLEIAPTRVFPDSPYCHLQEAKEWRDSIVELYHLEISSMQSIWYGHKEKLFGTKSERKILLDYTKQAVDFAEVVGCQNLVFGSPVNRDTDSISKAYPIAVEFFRELGQYALEHHTVISIEPNPVIYKTHFINTTEQAAELVDKVDSEGIRVNVDLGTILNNEEDIRYLLQIPEYINHIHISEPGLKMIEKRNLHRSLFQILKKINYQYYVSIEMSNVNDEAKVLEVMDYVNSLQQI